MLIKIYQKKEFNQTTSNHKTGIYDRGSLASETEGHGKPEAAEPKLVCPIQKLSAYSAYSVIIVHLMRFLQVIQGIP